MNPIKSALEAAEALVRKLKEAQAIVTKLAAESPDGLADLTDREKEIYALLGQGLDLDQIAAQLKLSLRTVHTHRDHLKKKLGVARSKDLYRRARESRSQ